MLDQLGRHGGFDLDRAGRPATSRSTATTPSRTSASSLGEAFREALGDKAGVRRFASGLYPLDEALVEVALDLSGRPFVVYEVAAAARRIPLGDPPFDPQLAEHFWQLASPPPPASRCTSRCVRGRNTHHIVEATFKGVARCLRDAVRVEGGGVPSHQGRAVTADRPLVAVLDYGIGNLRSAQKALEHVGADARLTADRGADRRRRRRRAARRGRLRSLHGGAARRRARRRRPRRRRRRAGRSSASASACRCCSRAPRRTPGAAGLGVLPGTVRWLPDGVKRPQMQWNVLELHDRTIPLLRRPRTPSRGCTSSTRSRRARRRRVVVGHLRLRRAGRRRRRARATCGPRSSTRRSRGPPAWSCWPTSSAWRPGSCAPERPAMIELYPAIDLRGGRCVRLYQGDYERETVYGDDPVAGRAGVRGRRRAVDPRRRPRRGPHRRAGEPRRGRRDRRRRWRHGVPVQSRRRRARRRPRPRRWSTPAWPGS